MTELAFLSRARDACHANVVRRAPHCRQKSKNKTPVANLDWTQDIRLNAIAVVSTPLCYRLLVALFSELH